jgi:selenocysteine-specific elongation factor
MLAFGRKLILGTAGHIDHGKTALVRALTGIDCDRLPEEKQRGITIDIGFAHLDLHDVHLGIIDVPGHERFIRNMLAGASGIDMVMLVIAADDSVMPQTREHLEILRLLDLEHGLIALTKCDLAEPNWLEMVEQDVRQLVRGTFLDGAPIVRTSATANRGITELKRTIEQVCAAVHQTPTDDVFRLAVDRSFVVHGRGTVVTGTVWSGQLRVDEQVEWLPAQRLVRVRGIQSHGRDVSEVIEGQRAAINLPDLHHSDISRGHELATPGYLKPSRWLTARARLLPDAPPRGLGTRAQVRLHLGTQERVATISTLDGHTLVSGESALVQLRCADPACAVAGQPFVLRTMSPVMTIGGGHVARPAPRRIAPRAAAEADRIAELFSEDPITRAAAAVYFFDVDPWSELDLARDGQLARSEAIEIRRQLVNGGVLVELGGRSRGALHRDVFDRVERRVLRAFQHLYDANPLQRDLPSSKLIQSMAGASHDDVIEDVIDRMIESGKLVGDAHLVAKPQFKPKLTAAQARLRETVLRDFGDAALAPPDPAAVARRAGVSEADLRPVLELCLADGDLVHVGQGMFLHRDAEAQLRARVREMFSNGERLTLSRIREMLGTTRKYALPFCEYLDRIGITHRIGDERVLVIAAGLRPARPPAR